MSISSEFTFPSSWLKSVKKTPIFQTKYWVTVLLLYLKVWIPNSEFIPNMRDNSQVELNSEDWWTQKLAVQRSSGNRRSDSWWLARGFECRRSDLSLYVGNDIVRACAVLCMYYVLDCRFDWTESCSIRTWYIWWALWMRKRIYT